MEPEAKYALVGTSVLILLGLVVASVVWLVASGQTKDTQSYKIYFTRQSLEGLQVRSDVRMRGIRIGAVTDFSFSARQPGTVEVTVAVEPTTPVRESTRAVVDRNLITGLASIRLLNLSEDSPRVPRPRVGAPEAVIAEGESMMQQLSETAEQMAQRADETMRRINATLSDENQVAFAETLRNLSEVSRNAKGMITRLDKALASVDRAADTVSASGSAISADVHGLADRYDTLGAETAAGIRDATGTIRQLSADVSRLSNRTESLLTDTDFELRFMGQQVRLAADALGSTARKFSDPRSVLFGPAETNLGPGEVRR